MTQPPQDPQSNPWETPGGGTPPQNPYGQQGGPDFSKEQPPPYGGQGGPYGGQQPPGGYGQQPPGYGQQPPGGIPPYSGGGDPYGGGYGGAPMIAGKGKRLLGIIIDWLIYFVLACCIGLPFGNSGNNVVVTRPDGTTTYEWDKAFSAGQVFASLLAAALAFLYFWLVTYRWNGQTLGKKATGTRVVREDNGGAIDSTQSATRSAVFVLLSYVCCIGGLVDAIWIFTNPQNQTLHDKVAKTVVVDATGPNPYQPTGYGQTY